ncbi:MAG TPA: cyclic nucleotide-gated ion channel, partial [Methylomirabilota bacterium]|nr:cyclic nucleotide-gated ion channel [Methylomirabilota bacterium]
MVDEPTARLRLGPAANILLIGVIVGSVAGAVLETAEPFAGRHRAWLRFLELVTLVVFTAEYVVRLWRASSDEPGGAAPWRARLRYAASPLGLIDLVAILPLVAPVLPLGPDGLRVLRLVRLLKLARYAPALSLFAAVLRNESRPLLAALMVMVVLLVFASAVMFGLEREAQPQVFASIPHTMWWTIVTMATVGYGDVVPITAAGKLFGGMVMILGIAMFAVPAGILATGFASELRKRDVVVTWQTVAKVPLFAELDAARIAEIARLLKREIVPAKYVVVRRGEPAEAMFFIMSGELEVDLQPQPRRMGPGHYFGEIALLRDTVRTATVTTITECQLLTLDVADFRR